MVDLITTGDLAIFEVVGWHKFLALKKRITVPLHHIRAVRADPDVNLGCREGWRMPGTHVPGVIVAGTFYQRGRRIFWDVVQRNRTIVVDVENDRYDQLIVEVENPGAAVERLGSAIESASFAAATYGCIAARTQQ